MSTTAPAPSGDLAAAGHELEESLLVEHARLEEAERVPTWQRVGVSASLFLVAAAAFAVLGSVQPFSPVRAAIATAAYAVASLVQFEVGSGFAVPTQLVFVPMWFLVPPGLLPLAVLAATVVAQVPQLVRGRMPRGRLVIYVATAWFAVGPALVLSVHGALPLRWSGMPVYAGALAAQFAVNFASAVPQLRGYGIGLREQARMMAPALAVDAALAPLGFVLAFPAVYRHSAVLLAALPLLALLAFFAQERRRRVDHAVELSHAYRGTALLLGDVIEADDAYTGSHSRDVVELTLAVADRLGLDAAARRDAELAALLHDVGKVRIPSEIINKPGPLDPEERAIINTHTIEGERMLEKVGGLLGRVGRIVRSCHERWDGGGYPDGLAGDAIPLAARIVCACDAFNAMTTDRSYRRALPTSEAKAELARCSGTHFDPRVVGALLSVVD